MNALGAAPAYYEVSPPAGAFTGMSPKGVMMLIHGGGWHKVGPGIVAADRGRATAWRERGWTTVSITYSGCGKSVDDVLWFYDHIRTVWPSAAICAGGYSAGGHLALMVAALRPGLACAVSEGGPMDLPGFATQVAYDEVTGGTTSVGPTRVYNLAVAAFGHDRLSEMSPITYATAIRSRLLLASAVTDPLIPLIQADSLAAAVHAVSPDLIVDVRVLDAGDTNWIHSNVLGSALDVLHDAEANLVNGVLGII
jgi:acetyl esterase/lipase